MLHVHHSSRNSSIHEERVFEGYALSHVMLPGPWREVSPSALITPVKTPGTTTSHST